MLLISGRERLCGVVNYSVGKPSATRTPQLSIIHCQLSIKINAPQWGALILVSNRNNPNILLQSSIIHASIQNLFADWVELGGVEFLQFLLEEVG